MENKESWEGVLAAVEVHGLSFPQLAINLYDYLHCNSVEEFVAEAEAYLKNSATRMFKCTMADCNIIKFSCDIRKETIDKWLELKDNE